MLEGHAQRALSALPATMLLSRHVAQQALPRAGFLASRANFSTSACRRDILDSLMPANAASRPQTGFSASEYLKNSKGANPEEAASLLRDPEPHHLNIVTHRHNTHITLTKPNKDPMLSVSTGNIGFRKQHRGTYDAAYQLGAFVMSTIQERGWLMDIKQVELIFKGFGEGREAVRKVILGIEGYNIRNRIIRVTDDTKLKFGGARAKKPRRLG
ncbi:uncharacterized protein K452DRAFT_283713 [Aplosporella prunicola CBS 121167]|uniref:Mitochondrial ribosomal protein subunit S18 n=1 Tax=Aplosporella prunicola CBS 121167 TaxID=1176127 RepID=A0A6A6BQ35_9PEZI|nr:uncharacterized protein K452DRAFT_283713 [Aplosporella prunicola CBS 121167]KAF2145354.1 hypothetical protein K452DRAFT_283713 [Aplosporella prunicola CBS 121167]